LPARALRVALLGVGLRLLLQIAVTRHAILLLPRARASRLTAFPPRLTAFTCAIPDPGTQYAVARPFQPIRPRRPFTESSVVATRVKSFT